MLIAALVIIGVLLLLASIFSVSDNLIQIEAEKQGIDTKQNNLRIMPLWREITGKKPPAYSEGNNFYKLKRGHDIKLAGLAEDEIRPASINRFAVKPTDFRGIAPIPKVEVEQGDDVVAGQPIFFDKSNPEIKYVAPVSGEVVEIRRGAKRSISHIVILADKQQRYKTFNPPSVDAPVDDLRSFLFESGIWPLINQRPFDIVPEPDMVPANIFISTFSTAPLATDSNLVAAGNQIDMQKGIDVLKRLTSGNIHLGLDGRKGHKPSQDILNLTNVKKHYFDGPHPAGNVGVQIHHIEPINKNTSVWTLKLETLILLGRLFNTGKYDTTRVVSLNGTPLKEQYHVQTFMGASINEMIQGNVVADDDSHRVVIGDVLSGNQAENDDFMSATGNQITLLEEGDDYELFGWLLPVTPRPSVSGTFPNFLFSEHRFDADTNTHGERRAFVVTGQYEKLLPMDIYLQHLMKAIMTGEIEKMEGLGINELTEEDVALPEFACTSKMPLQEILRDGLEMMREQA